jgi:hypothetical protein
LLGIHGVELPNRAQPRAVMADGGRRQHHARSGAQRGTLCGGLSRERASFVPSESTSNAKGVSTRNFGIMS